MNRPPAQYVAQRDIPFIDATLEEGAKVAAADVSALPSDLRKALKRRREQAAEQRPDQKVVAIWFEGKARWVFAPIDVRLHLAPVAGMLRRQRVSRG